MCTLHATLVKGCPSEPAYSGNLAAAESREFAYAHSLTHAKTKEDKKKSKVLNLGRSSRCNFQPVLVAGVGGGVLQKPVLRKVGELLQCMKVSNMEPSPSEIA